MTKSRVLAAVAATVLMVGLLPSDIQAQGNVAQPAMAPAGGPVALLDVSRVYKAHPRFNAMMEQMKTHVQSVEGWVKSKREEAQALAEEMKGFQSGSQEYKDREAKIAQIRSDLQVQMELQRKDLLQQEAKIYHNVYAEIVQEVESIAAARGFVTVLRFNGEDVNVDEPDNVLQFINRSVIWHNQAVDITDDVLMRIQSRSQHGAAATGSNQNRQGIPLQQQPPTRR